MKKIFIALLMLVCVLPCQFAQLLLEDEPFEEEDNRASIGISVGSVVPMGNLQHIFSFAPAFGLDLNFPFQNRGILSLDFKIGAPIGKHSFRYLDFDDTKTNVFGLIGLRYSFLRTKINENLTLLPHCGIGCAAFFTNKVKNVYEYIDEYGIPRKTKDYYDITTIDLQAGAQLVCKDWGISAAYHIAPFSKSSKINNDFGNNYFTVGLLYYCTMP
ncbi:MAG: hypothetical protein LBS52_09990 [Dysgonamonadaceae bacterium]|jgi:hypothetical protein|nr:hypothetical protein [Dysgonamonadaceae bacterium]